MYKRWICILLAGLMLLTLLAPIANATETETQETVEAAQEETKPSGKNSGTCGDGLTWKLEKNTLTVSGSGAMEDEAPWATRKDKIKKVVFTGGVTYVGADTFSGCEALEVIEFGDSLVEIGERAFLGCTGLTTIQLPKTFRKFGAECFRGCANLKSVYCAGPMPSFRGNCLWTGDYISIYTSPSNTWPADSVAELVHNFSGRLEVYAGGGDTAYVAPEIEETEAAVTEPVTEPTMEPTTAPTTVPETEPTTEPTTVPTTQAPTEETAAPETTVAVTEAPEEPQEMDAMQEAAKKVENKGWIGLVLIAGVFTLLIIGAMIFRSSSRKGGKYSE